MPQPHKQNINKANNKKTVSFPLLPYTSDWRRQQQHPHFAQQESRLDWDAMLLSRFGICSQSVTLRNRRPMKHVSAAGRCCCRAAAAAVSIRCQASRVKKSKQPASRKKGVGSSRSKGGFGGKPQEGWEAELLPPYRVYYKQGYKPPRFQGPLKLATFEGDYAYVALVLAHVVVVPAVRHMLLWNCCHDSHSCQQQRGGGIS